MTAYYLSRSLGIAGGLLIGMTGAGWGLLAAMGIICGAEGLAVLVSIARYGR